MKKNYMLPVIPGVERVGGFEKLPELKLIDYKSSSEFLKARELRAKQFLETF